jgi:hypothetical protein
MREPDDHMTGDMLDQATPVLPSVIEDTPPTATEQLLMLAKAGDPAAFWRACKGDVLDALRALRDDEPGEYEAFRAEVKAACTKINVTALDRMIRGDDAGPHASQATELAELAADKCELWHDADGEAYASFQGTAGETQHWRIESSGFRDWLAHLAFTEMGAAPGADTLKAALGALSGRAKFDGEEHAPARRVAKTDAGHWLDLGDEQWRAILLTPGGWSVVAAPPVRFLRNKATRAFPIPSERGDVNALWSLVNVPEADRLLVLAWMLECWRADTPYAVLEISGEQGAAKSTAQRILRGFIDPNDVPLRGRPKSPEDIYVAAANAHLLSFENLSTLSAEQSDALCAVTTGAGFAARQLYTNGEESLLKAHRPVALNGINPVVTRPDLLDRAISLHLPRLAERKTDEQVREAVETAAPAIFAGLLDLYCSALKLLPKVRDDNLPLPRMADFAQIGEAIAREMGHPRGHFLDLYAAHRRLSIQRTIDASPVAAAIVRMVESGGTFNGTVGELLEVLNRNRPDHEATDYWPKSPRGLGDALRRYSPALAQIGIKAEVESRPRARGFVHCDIGRLPTERFFQASPQRNDINNVNNINRAPPPVDVVDVVDVVSGHPRAKKALPQRGDIINDPVEVDL